MDRRLTRFGLFVLAGIAAGCAATPSPGTDPGPMVPEGSFRFIQQVPGGTFSSFEGILTLRGETVTVQTDTGLCRSEQVSDHQSWRYVCGELILNVDRHYPLGRSTWEVPRISTSTARQVCRRTDRGGIL